MEQDLCCLKYSSILDMANGSLGSLVLWIAIGLAVCVILALLLRRRRPADQVTRGGELFEQARQAAKEAVANEARDIQEHAIQVYQKQQDDLRAAEALKRREAAARAQETKARRIEELQQWRPPFVLFVRRLAEPFFSEWNLDSALLDHWSEERSGVYIKQKPYVLEIVRAIHADAEKAARDYATLAQKSEGQIARERAAAVAQHLEHNQNCPYCEAALDETAHLDHIIPVQRGGPSVPWNLVFCCIPCNFAKRDLALAEFASTDYARKKNIQLAAILERLRSLGKFAEVRAADS